MNRSNKTSPWVTLGIPTYNRGPHLLARLKDLHELGYLQNPCFEIIIHDNDSADKIHCDEIRKNQKRNRNIFLIQSKPNVGMVRGCEKIIRASRGKWMILLGDDDPIRLTAGELLKCVCKADKADHIFFKPEINSIHGPTNLAWSPNQPEGFYKTSRLCACMGFTTLFAFLGAHAFRRKPNMAEEWIKSHRESLFYGHVVMLLRRYRKSYHTHKSLAAWNPGNERISHQLNLLRLLELKALFSKPPTHSLRKFVGMKPLEVTVQGRKALTDHIRHPHLDFLNRIEAKEDRKSIRLVKAENLKFLSEGPIFVGTRDRIKAGNYAAAFFWPRSRPQSLLVKNAKIALEFECQTQFDPMDVLRIIAKLRLDGPILVQGQKKSVEAYYLSILRSADKNQGNAVARLSVQLRLLGTLLASCILFGPEHLSCDKVILNFLERPRKNLYKIILEAEKSIRFIIRRVFPKHKHMAKRPRHFAGLVAT